MTARVNNFDVLKQMATDNLDIRMSPGGNIINMKKVKAGTEITIGVEGNVVTPILVGDLVGCMLLYNKKQFDEIKAKLEAQS